MINPLLIALPAMIAAQNAQRRTREDRDRAQRFDENREADNDKEKDDEDRMHTEGIR